MAPSARRRGRKRRRLDRGAAAAVAGWSVAIVSTAVAAWSIQSIRSRPALLATADSLAHGRPARLDLAARYVDAYLRVEPGDARALALKAEILERSASGPEGLLAAIEAADHARRLDPGRQDVRRRLIDCYLKLRRMGALRPFQEKAARSLAKGLRFEGGDAAESHRLAARVLDELAPGGDPSAIDGAIGHYRLALADDPGDVESARALAGLLLKERGDPAGASSVLDALMGANPSKRARLARHRVWLEADPEDRSGQAAAELAAALEAFPRDLDVRLAAAEAAIREGRAGPARRHLDAIDRASRDDPRVWRARGLIGLIEEHRDEAIEDWRRGLALGGGGDADLAWRIAFVLLDQGRTREATALIARLDALDGPGAPGNQLLRALRDLREGRPIEAIGALSLAETRASGPLMPLASEALGRAFEATGDEAPALAAFERAARAAPADPGFRLSLARALRAPRPAEAAAELRRAVAADPKSPALRVALARSELEAQAGRPRESRDWSAFAGADAEAAKVAPGSGPLAVVEADALALMGRGRDALDLLKDAVRLDRRSAPLRASLARRLAGRGELDEALLALERAGAPENAGDRIEVRSARAEVLALRGPRGEVRASLVDNLDRLPTPDRPVAWAALGDLLRVVGDEAGALSAFERWAGLGPEDPGPRLFFLGYALDEGGPEADRAARAALDSLESSGAARGLHARVGRALDLLRDPSNAEPPGERSRRLALVEAAIGEAARVAPESRWIPLLTGRLREAQGRWEEAIAAYESLLGRGGERAALRRLMPILARWKDDRLRDRYAAVRPDLTDRLMRLSALEALARGEADRAAALAEKVADDPGWRAGLLELLGRGDRAEAALRADADAHPGDEGRWMALIALQARLGRGESARSTAAEASSRVESGRPLLSSARLRLRAGDIDAALVDFGEALDRDPDDAEAAVLAADGLLEAGRGDLAEAALRRAVATRPRPHRADRMLASLLASRDPLDKIARDEARARVGPGSPDDTPGDRLARDWILSRVADEPDRSAAAGRFARGLADSPAIARALRRSSGRPFAEVRALALKEGGSLADRLAFSASLLDAAEARDPLGVARVVEEAEIRDRSSEIGAEEPPDFLDRCARVLSENDPGPARFLDARGVLEGGLGRVDEAIADLRSAAEAARGRVVEPAVLFHLARALSARGDRDDARSTLDRARRLGLRAESLGPLGAAELSSLESALR